MLHNPHLYSSHAVMHAQWTMNDDDYSMSRQDVILRLDLILKCLVIGSTKTLILLFVLLITTI